MAAPGRKAAVDPSPLPFSPRATGAARFVRFAEKFVKVPKGTGARAPMRIRDWQRDLAGSVLDAEVQPRTAGWLLPRGQGKSTLVAALGLYDLMCGEEGASVVVVAVDERQARIVFNTAKRMVELSPELETRVQVYADRLVVPARGASFAVLPASAPSLEGLDFTLAIVDEAGVVSRDVFEVVSLAGGKRERSTLIAIGTPGPDPDDSVLADLRNYAREHPEDTSQVYREHSAAGFEDHPIDCEHCWKLANPALDDFLYRDAVRALLPPKTRESTFRRARLGQWVTDTSGGFLADGVWDGLAEPRPIPPGADVIVSLDGSFNSDSTAIVVATVDRRPHFTVGGLWQAPPELPGWQVPVLEVEDRIRELAETFNVREVVVDPFRWQRTMQVLEADGLPVVSFPWSASRITAATADFFGACVNAGLTHDGDARLAAHIGAAVVHEDSKGGIRLDKAKRRGRKIDLAAAALMAHSRATWLATRPQKRRRARSFRT
ncbi:hypothetical protein GCM10010977_02500 [Citricoccus zhacaiensis]|uniref:Terminase n=1 Tax=Citricoccus zhacaiensis TaxID=489142 RepID=A0ABQ2LMR4_9MICC|nr:terminase TerL endonuclease subunit [Citricoccus zhacaiensis]GGO40347.1 hypothetical protein GCM10010977_02500 [Citricoccus zhacaiensis]